MAPEQAGGKTKSTGPYSDVYSLGAILYELLTGSPPLVGDSDLEIFQRVLNDEPVAPIRRRPGIPRDMETICLTFLAKDPKKRYATVGALAEDLRRYLRGEPIVARRISLLARAGRWCKRQPLAAAMVTLLALLAIASPLVAISQSRLYREQKRLYGQVEGCRFHGSDLQSASR